eukprot:NODE_11_length_54881_cov_1.430718.p40 type:complete len:113 gc:universal NODE_11_length_54881_cov_1.430718:19016-18678(-)
MSKTPASEKNTPVRQKNMTPLKINHMARQAFFLKNSANAVHFSLTGQRYLHTGNSIIAVMKTRTRPRIPNGRIFIILPISPNKAPSQALILPRYVKLPLRSLSSKFEKNDIQ